ncbi:MAG: hypothetical protein LBG60_16725, partial [Bifidobacteriaceae bacterium]|nr:hypothetical protein [Bifidobacteriaceae bacterium]
PTASSTGTGPTASSSASGGPSQSAPGPTASSSASGRGGGPLPRTGGDGGRLATAALAAIIGGAALAAWARRTAARRQLAGPAQAG